MEHLKLNMSDTADNQLETYHSPESQLSMDDSVLLEIQTKDRPFAFRLVGGSLAILTISLIIIITCYYPNIPNYVPYRFDSSGRTIGNLRY